HILYHSHYCHPSVYEVNTHVPPYIVLFAKDPSPTEIYTLSLHDALPICKSVQLILSCNGEGTIVPKFLIPHCQENPLVRKEDFLDRKSTRLNSSHVSISYAVFCLKKKKKNESRASHRLHTYPYRRIHSQG